MNDDICHIRCCQGATGKGGIEAEPAAVDFHRGAVGKDDGAPMVEGKGEPELEATKLPSYARVAAEPAPVSETSVPKKMPKPRMIES